MPPFQTLTTDNERERKAEYHRPGTYIVLALQETFANSAEYREKDRIFQPNSSRDPHIFHYEPGSTPLPLIESGDPDIVILPAFDGNVESGIQMENSPSPAETTLAEASSTQTLHNDGFLDSPVPHICVPETLRRGDSQCMDCYQHLELPCLPNLRQVYQNMVLLARKVGQLSRRLRAEFEFQMNIGSDQLYRTHRQCQVVGMLELLHSEHMGWYPHFPELAMSYQNRPQLPAGVADYLDQVGGLPNHFHTRILTLCRRMYCSVSSKSIPRLAYTHIRLAISWPDTKQSLQSLARRLYSWRSVLSTPQTGNCDSSCFPCFWQGLPQGMLRRKGLP